MLCDGEPESEMVVGRNDGDVLPVSELYTIHRMFVGVPTDRLRLPYYLAAMADVRLFYGHASSGALVTLRSFLRALLVVSIALSAGSVVPCAGAQAPHSDSAAKTRPWLTKHDAVGAHSPCWQPWP